MHIYGWDLSPIKNNPLRDDMIVALNEIITHNNNGELMIVIKRTGGINNDIIAQTVIYGSSKECDVLWREVDPYISKKLSLIDLSEDFWGPFANPDISSNSISFNKSYLCFYKGKFYNGIYKGGFIGQ